MPKEGATPAEKRAAALGRAGNTVPNMPRLEYGTSVASTFANQRVWSSDERRVYKMPAVRMTADLGDQIATFGNAHNMTLSEAVRALLRMGLEHQHCP